MVLYIAIDGITGFEQKYAQRLQKFFEKKNYQVAYISQNKHHEIDKMLQEYELSNDQLAILSALNRSILYYENNFDKLDIAIWSNSVISDNLQYTDTKVNTDFIKNINRYFPKMDLYIILEEVSDDQNYYHNYQKYIQANDNLVTINQYKKSTDEIFESIVKKCFECLPKCSWCGRIFTKSTKNKKYCSTNCRKYAREEQNRENNRNYYNRYKDVLTERTKNQLGSKGANLHEKADKDFDEEKRKVQNGLKAIGLKSRI